MIKCVIILWVWQPRAGGAGSPNQLKRQTGLGDLDGKIAIVTGTSRGVGVGIAHELLRAGATVIGCSRSPLDAIPGIDADWADRASQQICDHAHYQSLDS